MKTPHHLGCLFTVYTPVGTPHGKGRESTHILSDATTSDNETLSF